MIVRTNGGKRKSDSQSLIEKTKGMPAKERIEILEQEIQAKTLERKLSLIESTSILIGSGLTDLVRERQDCDDGQFWEEIGGRSRLGKGALRPASEQDLEIARCVGRQLSQENEFAIGAHKSRISFIVGTGTDWNGVAKKGVEEDEAFITEIDEIVEEFEEFNRWPTMEQEGVLRSDRDGEYFYRLFRRPNSPLIVRAIEPEDVRSPTDIPGMANIFMGVETSQEDVRNVIAYWVREGMDQSPRRIPRIDLGQVIPNIVHRKSNVDLNSRRGWISFWSIRKNLRRAEKLLKNMSDVASLQAKIALIRRHENASRAEVQSFLGQNRDVLIQDSVTNRETRVQKITGPTIIDTGAGTTYEAPISSVNAANNVSILQAELRSAAAAIQQPEFMFTADASNANFASTQVAEAPAIRNFEREQISFKRDYKVIVKSAVIHRISDPQRFIRDYDIQGISPSLVVRDRIGEAQRFQIERDAGVISIRTWRGLAGHDDEEEERNFEEERSNSEARGLTGPLEIGDEDDMGDDPPSSRPLPRSPSHGSASVESEAIRKQMQSLENVVTQAVSSAKTEYVSNVPLDKVVELIEKIESRPLREQGEIVQPVVNVTVPERQVVIRPPDVNVDARTTVQPSRPAQVTAPITVNPAGANVTFQERSINVDASISPGNKTITVTKRDAMGRADEIEVQADESGS